MNGLLKEERATYKESKRMFEEEIRALQDAAQEQAKALVEAGARADSAEFESKRERIERERV